MASTLENALRLVKPGGMVVSITDILDKLGNKITDAEKEQLLIAMLSPRREKVQRGDLITSDLINQVLGDIEDLQVRVAQLESVPASNGTNKPTIISVSPSPVNANGTLTVTGFNFPLDPDLSKVDLGGAMVSSFLTANDKVLVFTVPHLSRSLPADLLLTVRNSGLSDTSMVRVLPAQIQLTGKVLVQNKTPSLPAIVVGNSYQVDFSIDSQTNISETYGVAAIFTAVTGTATADDWSHNTRLSDPAAPGNALSRVSVSPGVPKTVRVNFTVPSGAVSAKLQVGVSSVSSPSDINLNKASDPLELKVGQVVTPSDPRTTFVLRNYGPAITNARLAQIDGRNGVEINFGATQWVRADATFSLKGAYDFSYEVSPDSTGWTVPGTSLSPAPGPSNEQAGGVETIAVSVTSIGTSTPQRTLKIKAVRRADADGPSFTSWTEIPIRGF